MQAPPGMLAVTPAMKVLRSPATSLAGLMPARASDMWPAVASAITPNSGRSSPSTITRARSVTPWTVRLKNGRRSMTARISPRRLVTPMTWAGTPGRGVKPVKSTTSRTKRLSMA